MTRDRLATRKWKVPSDISESRLMMRLPSLSKSKSEVFGQSGHCSARLLAALRATWRHMQSEGKDAAYFLPFKNEAGRLLFVSGKPSRMHFARMVDRGSSKRRARRYQPRTPMCGHS